MLFFVLAACLCMASAAKDPGYIVTGQFKCLDAFCPDWELDVTRLQTEMHLHDELVLQTLIPKSPVADMSFPVFTAYDATSRVFVTAGVVEKGNFDVWSTVINSAVTNSSALQKVKVTYPSASSTLVGLEVQPGSNSTILALFREGDVVQVDLATGKSVTFVDVCTGNKTRVVSKHAHAISSTGILYTFTTSETGADRLLTAVDLKTKSITSTKLKGTPLSFDSVIIDLMWIEAHKSLALVASGNFDQIAMVDPATNELTMYISDLGKYSYEFDCDMGTKACDMLNVDTYNSVGDELFLQATYNDNGDLSTVLMSIPLAKGPEHAIPTTKIDPFSFGFMGFHYVLVE